MGQLEHVQRALSQKRQTPEVVSVIQSLQLAVSALTQKLDIMLYERQGVPWDEFKGALNGTHSGVKDLSNRLDTATASLLSKETDLGPVLKSVDALKSSVDRLMAAVSGITIPAPVVEAPVVNVPEVDLTPILEQINAIRGDWSEISYELPGGGEVEIERKPTEWTFDVKRNQAGFIKSIEAKAK